MKEKTSRFTPPQKAMERTKQRKEKQNKIHKIHLAMNKSASFTLVQGPSTVVCMIVT
jgi:hypothetical protein